MRQWFEVRGLLKVILSEPHTNSRRMRCRAVSPINKAAKVTNVPALPHTQRGS
ncbi:MAG: hypothetical protein J6J31_11905 [Thermoguttaceae bacterium]|nr:hypothetical protein [Thermoguttaceae bacterium]